MRILSPKVLILASIVCLFGLSVWAQEGPPNEMGANRAQRPNLLEALGLTQDQVRQIRMMNRGRKPLMDAAQTRLRDANRELDMAIYGDTLDEAEVRARLSAFQQAQAEVARIRFQSEVQLRKILTSEQLAKFRMLRERLARSRETFSEGRQGPRRGGPVQRIRQLSNRNPVN